MHYESNVTSFLNGVVQGNYNIHGVFVVI